MPRNKFVNKKSAKKKSRFLLKFFDAFHVFARSTRSRRSANRQPQVRERIIRAFRKFNGVSFEDVHEEIFDVTGFSH